MTVGPVLPFGGYAGWRFLNRTLTQQQSSFRQDPPLRRLSDHFRARIASVRTAEDLVSDRRLLQVALGAFGLSADLDSRAFVRQVLEGGTLRPDALANRLSDKRYAAMAFEFGFGNLGPRTGLSGFADAILARYESQSFQEAVGQADPSLRLALNVADGLRTVVGRTSNANAQWYAMMANPPLRQVFQTALGLPKSFAGPDIERQLVAYKDRAEAIFGTDRLADFQDPSRQEALIRRFLLRAEAMVPTPAATALQLLRPGG